jgi:hypothetical protein
VRALSDAQIQQFIQDGFVRVDRAFPREFADEAREIMCAICRAIPMTQRPGPNQSFDCRDIDKSRSGKPSIRLFSMPRSIRSSAKGVGFRATVLASSRCGFRIPTIRAMPAGVLM